MQNLCTGTFIYCSLGRRLNDRKILVVEEIGLHGKEIFHPYGLLLHDDNGYDEEECKRSFQNIMSH
jgi:hypothetical protein